MLKRLTDIVEWWSAFLLALMVTVVFFGVFFRYALNSALVWYDEFASYLLVWLTFYGSVVASFRRRHVRLDLVLERLSPGAKRAMEFVSEVFVFGFQIVLFYYGALLTQKLGDESSVSLDWVRMTWVYSVLPITGGMMLLVSGAELARIVMGERWPLGAPAAVSVHPEGQKETQVKWSGSSLE
jgi:TRAP-type C4-dicarboxylate transport system permease small subunit